MRRIDSIIAAFGGIRPMSAKLSALGPRRVSPGSVSYWKRSGHIPTKRLHSVVAAAKHHGIAIELSDLVGPA